MYFVLNPFFYFIVNKANIENYIIISAHGELPHLMSYNKLKSIVKDYIYNKCDDINETKKDNYVTYICDHLSYDTGNR